VFHTNLRVLDVGRRFSVEDLIGYEPLLHALGTVTAKDVERLCDRLALAADPRDALAARDSLKRLLRIPLPDG
jgi:hypothetical protein